MGAWGYGILQNDTAQDGLCEVAYELERTLKQWKTGSETNAARLGAAIGLLLAFSPYSFEEESPFFARLIKVLRANQPYFDRLPGMAGTTFNSILKGDSWETVAREGNIPLALEIAFHGEEEPRTFVMQKAFAIREPDLFCHPDAIAWLRDFARGLVKNVDEGMEDGSIVCDLSREGEFMGAFAILCLLGSDIVDREHFVRWRVRVHEVMKDEEPSGDEMEDRFTANYYRLLDGAFDYVLSNPANQTA